VNTCWHDRSRSLKVTEGHWWCCQSKRHVWVHISHIYIYIYIYSNSTPNFNRFRDIAINWCKTASYLSYSPVLNPNPLGKNCWNIFLMFLQQSQVDGLLCAVNRLLKQSIMNAQLHAELTCVTDRRTDGQTDGRRSDLNSSVVCNAHQRSDWRSREPTESFTCVSIWSKLVACHTVTVVWSSSVYTQLTTWLQLALIHI